MPLWFCFGDKPNSWAVANGTLLDFQNMPEGYEGKFKMNEWNSNTITSIGTGGYGYYWVYLSADGYAAYGPKDLMPLVKVDFLGRGRPVHIAYGPGGMYFARFKAIGSEAGTTVWGPPCEEALPPVYSTNWVNIVKALRAHEGVPKNEGAVDFVAFGCHDLLLIRYENGNAELHISDEPELAEKCKDLEVVKLCVEKFNDGWTVGNKSSLCQRDATQYFIEWKKGTQTFYNFNIGTAEETQRVKDVITLVGHDANAQAVNDRVAIFGATMRANQALAMQRAFR